jgi:hypothetical protein
MQEVARLYSGLVASGFAPTLHQTAICCAAYLSTKQTLLAVPLMDSLLAEEYKPPIDHVAVWAYAFTQEERMDSTCDLLQDAVARDPAFALPRVGCLCIMYFCRSDANRLAALCREGRLINVDDVWQGAQHCSSGDSSKGWTCSRLHALTLAICGHTKRALAAFQEHGFELDCISKTLLLLSGCLAVEQHLQQNLVNVLDALRDSALEAGHARQIAQTCAAYDCSALQRVLTALNSLKLSGEAQLTQPICSLAVAAAYELNDAGAAVMWFHVMQSQGMRCDQLLYRLVVCACISSRKHVHELWRVLKAAKAAGLMPELTDDNNSAELELLHTVESFVEPLMAKHDKVLLHIAQLQLAKSGGGGLDMTDDTARWCDDDTWDFTGGPAIAAAAAVRLFLTDAAQKQPAHHFIKLADVLQSAAVPVASGLTVDNNDEVCIKFTTGSAIGCAVAKELYEELKSGAVSNISIDVDAATTYTVTVPGLQSYFASWRRDPTANSMRA